MPLSTSKRPLVTHLYTADPSAHVFEDRIYVYPSHDLDLEVEENDRGDQYRMTDYHVFSQEHAEGPVTDHGEALHLRDVPWASQQMWAPDAACKDGRYYLYFPARDQDDIFRIGVATSDRPAGPFVAEKVPIKGSFSIDPCVFEDDDGSFYMYFGGLWGGQLQCWSEKGFDRDAPPPPPEALALLPCVARLSPDMLQFAAPPQRVKITDEDGALLRAGDIQRRYFEGPWMHKYQGVYYLSYSTGDAHTLVYATGASPTGPFTFRGRILDPVIGWTTHHSIIEHAGRWWLYYHDASLSNGTSHKRCVKVQELFYNADGSIQPLTP
jgi:beta-xylosidase